MIEVFMALTLDLRPDIEARLAAQAHAKGISLDAYVRDAIEALANAASPRPIDARAVKATLDKLAEMGKDLPHLPSSALTRESIYRDHD
jgi:hypothetical protein